MDFLEHFESMWAPKIKRKLVTVPTVSYSAELRIGSLNNEDWHFKVPYAFREALDLKYEKRMKDKKTYMTWTQGPILKFKNGDSFISKYYKTAIQVQFSSPMGWDSTKNEMYQGSIVFDQFSINDHKYTKLKRYSCSQMEFLKILVNGVKAC